MSTAYPTPPASPDQPYQQPYRQQYQYGGYGTPYAAPHHGYPQPGVPAPAASPPATVVLAFRLLLAQIVVSVIGSVAVLFGASAATGSTQYGGVTFTGSSFAVLVGVVLASLVVGNGLWLFFGLKMLAGRNWARIVLTVFAALGVLGTLTSLGSATAITLVLSLIGAALNAGMIVCLFRSPSAPWFAPRA